MQPPHPDEAIELYAIGSMSSAQEVAPTVVMADDTAAGEDECLLESQLEQPKTTEGGPPSLFVWLLTLSAGVSGLLFGYDTGVISATLVSIDTSLTPEPLTSFAKSIITSSTALAALLASPLSSLVADSLGRKRVILAADVLFAVGAGMQAAAASVPAMVGGRAVVGAAIGAASLVVPLYIAEAAPAAHRGRLVTVNVLFVTLGQVLAYIAGWALTGRASGWRWMVGLGAVPAVLQVLLMFAMPESPRWLVRAGRRSEASAVVRRVAGDEAAAAAVLRDIETEVRTEEEAARKRPARDGPAWWWDRGWSELFAVRRNRRALAVACLLQGLQQLCGFNSLMYFSATIFSMLGFSVPTLTSLTVAVTNFVFTLVALAFIDRVGRRRMLLYSIPLMIAGLLLAAYGFSISNLSTVTAGGGQDRRGPIVTLFAIAVYVGAYAVGLGNVPWMQSELFALDVRSLGSGLATATNWLANFVVGLTFLHLMEALTPPWTFVLYAAFCGAGLTLISRIYPETAGLSLEEAASLLDGDGWGVGRA